MNRRLFFKATGALCGLLWLLATHSLSFGEEFPKPGKDDRCPVCGMFVNKYPKWAAGFVFQSGARYVHCCPKCMVHNLRNVPKYQPGETRENIRRIWVTEYYTTKPMDAREVFFVVGTSLVGPMGLDLIPVGSARTAESLEKDYHGQFILRLDEITPDILEKVRRGKFK